MTDAMKIARTGAFALFAAAAIWSAPVSAQTQNVSSYAPSVMTATDDDESGETPAHLRRQTVSYAGSEAPGTIIVDTPNTYLYYVLGGGKAIRYGIGVGREGFTWAGVKTVERKAEWPDWTPPPEMIARQPYLPRFMAGGPTNPLGARAMYLGGTVYRIHGTNAPGSIGKRVSSGCIRMLNEDVIDLYSRVNIGTKVVVLPMTHRATVAESRPTARSTDGRGTDTVASSYAPLSAPAAAWQGIRLRSVN
jgi:lipoprotein-anchoring transpeptidase ErfK/SrfK